MKVIKDDANTIIDYIKNADTSALPSEITLLKIQSEKLQNELAEKTTQLHATEEKYLEQYNSYDKMSQELTQKQSEYDQLKKQME